MIGPFVDHILATKISCLVRFGRNLRGENISPLRVET
jgi:hypothetical protein